MGFGDLQARDGLLLLNNFLADKSYVEGYRPTQGDVVVFEAVKKAPATDLENALRWYNHIASFSDAEKQKFEGQRQSIEHYGRQHGQDSQEKHEFKSLSVNPADKKAAKPADDDDVDLFGDDDNEEESEQTKERLAAYAAKKSKKPALVAKSTITLDVKPWDDETDMAELEKKKFVQLKLMDFFGVLPVWFQLVMESRNYKSSVLLKMIKLVLIFLKNV